MERLLQKRIFMERAIDNICPRVLASLASSFDYARHYQVLASLASSFDIVCGMDMLIWRSSLAHAIDGTSLDTHAHMQLHVATG